MTYANTALCISNYGTRVTLGSPMEVTSGGVVIPLSAVRLYGRRVPPRGLWTSTEVHT
jgi:hypothetical protein